MHYAIQNCKRKQSWCSYKDQLYDFPFTLHNHMYSDSIDQIVTRHHMLFLSTVDKQIPRLLFPYVQAMHPAWMPVVTLDRNMYALLFWFKPQTAVINLSNTLFQWDFLRVSSPSCLLSPPTAESLTICQTICVMYSIRSCSCASSVSAPLQQRSLMDSNHYYGSRRLLSLTGNPFRFAFFFLTNSC